MEDLTIGCISDPWWGTRGLCGTIPCGLGGGGGCLNVWLITLGRSLYSSLFSGISADARPGGSNANLRFSPMYVSGGLSNPISNIDGVEVLFSSSLELGSVFQSVWPPLPPFERKVRCKLQGTSPVPP